MAFGMVILVGIVVALVGILVFFSVIGVLLVAIGVVDDLASVVLCAVTKLFVSEGLTLSVGGCADDSSSSGHCEMSDFGLFPAWSSLFIVVFCAMVEGSFAVFGGDVVSAAYKLHHVAHGRTFGLGADFVSAFMFVMSRLAESGMISLFG